VHRLVEPDAAVAEARRGQHAERAGDLGGLVRQDVAEQVLGDDHVEAARVPHQQHRARVHELVDQRHVGEALGHLLDHLHPELRGLEHVGLVHVRHVLAAPARRLEGHPADAGDLDLVVHHRVARLALAADDAHPARLAEVQAAGQLAHHQQVDAVDDLGAQRRGLDQRREHAGGTQVGVQAQLLADAQQALLGAPVHRQRVPLRPAHGAEQHGTALLGQRHRLVAQRRPVGVDRRPADPLVGELELQPVARRHRLQRAPRLAGHLGADPVATHHHDPRFHR